MSKPALPELVEDPFYPRLKGHLIDTTGMVFYADKDEELARIIDLRLKETGLPSCSQYLELLWDTIDGKDEFDAIVAEMTIGETYFFRHKEQFDALRTIVLPSVINRNHRKGKLRIWSAGCATGAEPYSIAIMLKNDFGSRIAGWDVEILGTDINKKFLAVAQRGKYHQWALRATQEEVRDACFVPDEDAKSWQLAQEYRDFCTFQYHNLIETPFPSVVNNLYAFDLILCRNVTIYFSREKIRMLIGQFHETLVNEGWLIAGHSEVDLELFRSFKTVNSNGAVVYQKTRNAAHRGRIFADASPEPEGAPAGRSSRKWVPPVLDDLPAGFADPDGMAEAAQAATDLPLAAAPTEPGPGPAEGPLDQVRVLADHGQWHEALKICEDLLETDKMNPSVHLFYGLLLEQKGDAAESEQALRRAIYLDRGFVLPHYHLGLTLQKKGDAKGAGKSFRNVLKLLEATDDAVTYHDGDEISAGELKNLATMHLELIENR